MMQQIQTVWRQQPWWLWRWGKKKNKKGTRHMRYLLKVCNECMRRQEHSLTRWRLFARLCSSKSGAVAKYPFSPTLITIITIRPLSQAYSTELVKRTISSRQTMKAYWSTKSTRCRQKLQASATNNHLIQTRTARLHQIVFRWTDIKEMFISLQW